MSRAQAARRRFASLDAIELCPDEYAGTVICCHGYGADASDLAPLAEEIPSRAALRWIFPEALEPLGSSPWSGGRQWFPIDEEAMLQAQVLGTFRDFSKHRPGGLEKAAQALLGLFDAIEEPGLPVFLGGFSQGSMVALESVLSSEKSFGGLFVLSGNLVDEKGIKDRAPRRGNFPFFQSHGTQDPILGLEGADRLEAVLIESGWRGSLLRFDGGHAISPEVLEGLGGFFDSVVKTR